MKFIHRLFCPRDVRRCVNYKIVDKIFYILILSNAILSQLYGSWFDVCNYELVEILFLRSFDKYAFKVFR